MTAIASRKVLVLNRGWSPVNVVGMEAALGLVNRKPEGEPTARIIDVFDQYRTYTWSEWAELTPRHDEERIRGVSQDYRIPEVLLLSKYNDLPQQRGARFSRRTIYRRDGNQCQYCGCKPGTEFLNIDHVIPRAQGGLTTWENCVLSCFDCNTRKRDRTPAQAGMKLIRKPFKPKFTLFRGDHRCKSWETWLGEMYWNVELENDNSGGIK
jgi:5-methylcytosine-specific restriction endonuclease McrA